MLGASIFWETRDVLSYASVTPESFPIEFTRVYFFFGQHGMNCVGLSDTSWSCAIVVAQCSVNCAGVVRHIRCLLFSLSLLSFHLVHKTACSRLETLHATWLRKPHVSISSRMVAEKKREILVLEFYHRIQWVENIHRSKKRFASL